ncbi:MAG TPA: hypothetical protein VFW42_10680 [Fluviicoccus sp.]|nr:hypothetical protein [Fluviicoccus sp.]
MIQDFPHANARLAEVARHWADGEVSHETWRRERRNILRELCAKRADCQERPPLLSGSASRAVPEPVSAVAAAPAAVPVQPAPVPDSDAEVANEEVLTLALILAVVVVGAILVFFLA